MEQKDKVEGNDQQATYARGLTKDKTKLPHLQQGPPTPTVLWLEATLSSTGQDIIHKGSTQEPTQFASRLVAWSNLVHLLTHERVNPNLARKNSGKSRAISWENRFGPVFQSTMHCGVYSLESACNQLFK